MNQPHTTVVLAMTADGKITDVKGSPARFGSAADQAHLEAQIAQADAVIFGAGTLRAYGTTLPLSNPLLLEVRQQQQKPPQPVQIVCSASAKIAPNLRFFQQPIPRWLLTTEAGSQYWQSLKDTESKFERVIIADLVNYCSLTQINTDPEELAVKLSIDWRKTWHYLSQLGFNKVVVLGGGELVASLLDFHLIDELWLTICPVILGGSNAPTPVRGNGLLPQQAQYLELLSVETINQELFLHYRLL